MKIEVGEYVRTNNGYIAKVMDLNNYIGIAVNYGFINGQYETLGEDEILKHSKNIIDLIEVRRLCEWFSCSRNRFRK